MIELNEFFRIISKGLTKLFNNPGTEHGKRTNSPKFKFLKDQNKIMFSSSNLILFYL